VDFERPAAVTQEKQRHYGVSLKDLLDAGLLRPGQALVGTRNGVTYSGIVTADGHVELEDGRSEESPSTAGAAALGTQACNGWHFWQTDTPRGLVRLTRVRDDYLERQRR
jgi:modification methylase